MSSPLICIVFYAWDQDPLHVSRLICPALWCISCSMHRIRIPYLCPVWYAHPSDMYRVLCMGLGSLTCVLLCRIRPFVSICLKLEAVISLNLYSMWENILTSSEWPLFCDIDWCSSEDLWCFSVKFYRYILVSESTSYLLVFSNEESILSDLLWVFCQPSSTIEITPAPFGFSLVTGKPAARWF